MSIFAALVRNELEKTWRSRWLVFAIFFAIVFLIAGGLYAFYVYQEHRWSPPPATPWQTLVQDDITQRQDNINALQTEKQRSGGKVVVGPFGGTVDFDAAIKSQQTLIDNDNYLLSNDIAPVGDYSITSAALFAMGGIIMFLLTRIFGWLAAEQIAGERSDRTITILLSRPLSRDVVLGAKVLANFAIALVMVLAVFILVYLALGFLLGSLGPVTGQVGIPLDSSQPLGPTNIVVMQIPVFLLMALGATMLAILCVQGMSFLISTITGRWAAVGITLAVLFGAPVVTGIVELVIVLITKNQDSARFLNYIFFNALAPAGVLGGVFGSSSDRATTGMNEFGSEVLTLAIWTVGFFVASVAIFHRKQEAG